MMNKKKVLGIIISVGNVTVSEIVSLTRLKKATVTRIVNKLIKEGKVK